jgi:hypothetical protein
MKISKKLIAYAIVLLIFAAYLLYANDIFYKLIRLDKEARPARISLPAESQIVKFNIDKVKREDLKWKEAVYMRGWVFKENAEMQNRKVYLILKSKTSTLIFKVEKNNISRPDVSEFFHLDRGPHGHGFETYIPLFRLKEDSYRIGFAIADETGKYYSLSNNALRISKDSVFTEDYTAAFVSHKVSLSLSKATKEVTYNFGIVNQSGNYVNIQGWAFLKGLDAQLQKSYILLKNNENVFVFDIIIQTRPDVTSFFSKTGLNLDSCGFQAKIPMENLVNGDYRVGLYLSKANQTGTVYTDKFINIVK